MLQGRPNHQVVGEAQNGREAIEKAKQLSPDLVLLDIELPDLNGIQVAKHIQEVSPKSKILLVTMNEDAHLAKEIVQRDGVHGYLLKSDVQWDLWSAITDVLGGKRFVSKRLTR
jgi:two-component system, NarL family, response regulator NreC